MKKYHCCARKPGSLRSACACRASVNSSLTISVCGEERTKQDERRVGQALGTADRRSGAFRAPNIDRQLGTAVSNTLVALASAQQQEQQVGTAITAATAQPVHQQQRQPPPTNNSSNSTACSIKVLPQSDGTHLDAQHHEHERHVARPDEGEEGHDEDDGRHKADAEGAVARLGRLRRERW